MKALTLIITFFVTVVSIAQQIEPAGNPIKVEPFEKNYRYNNNNRTTSCEDTLLYLDTKMTSAVPISLNNSTSAHAFAQYYDCPSEVTLHGVQFIAYKTDNTNGDSIEIKAFVYEANSDSLPAAGNITEGTTMISNNTHGYDLNLLTKTIMFDSAVTVNSDYLIVIMNNTPTPVSLYSTDYNANDGQGEYLGSARIGFNWVRGYNINVGGAPYDADMLFYPIVSYELDAEFSHSPNCNSAASTDTMTNLSSGILFNRFYSQAALNGEDSLQFAWSFGDGSPGVNEINPVHDYPAGGYLIGLTATMMGWTNNCSDSDAIPSCYQPASTETTENFNFQIYPNPANDLVHLQSSVKLKKSDIYDMSGKLIYSENHFNSYKSTLNLNQVPNGVYIIKTQLENGNYIRRKLNVY